MVLFSLKMGPEEVGHDHVCTISERIPHVHYVQQVMHTSSLGGRFKCGIALKFKRKGDLPRYPAHPPTRIQENEPYTIC